MNQIIETFRKELLDIRAFKDKTIETYIRTLYKYLDFSKNHLKIDPLSTKSTDLLKLYSSLKKNNIGATELKNYKAVLNHFFSFLMKNKLCKNNPASDLPRIKKVKSDLNKPVLQETIIRLLKSFDKTSYLGYRNFIIVSLLWALGIRVSELVTIKLKDLTLDYDPEHNTGILLIHGKGSKERTLFVVDKLYTHLKDYLQLYQSTKQKNKPLITGRTGAVLSIRRVEQLITDAVIKAGIKERITPHVLRHTFATEMYHRHVPLEAISDMLGHESISETSLYIHVSDQLKYEILNKLSVKRSVS